MDQGVSLPSQTSSPSPRSCPVTSSGSGYSSLIAKQRCHPQSKKVAAQMKLKLQMRKLLQDGGSLWLPGSLGQCRVPVVFVLIFMSRISLQTWVIWAMSLHAHNRSTAWKYGKAGHTGYAVKKSGQRLDCLGDMDSLIRKMPVNCFYTYTFHHFSLLTWHFVTTFCHSTFLDSQHNF